MKTRITEMLGSKYPIIQGGMQWVGRAEMAAAVSNAGGFGILTALTQPTPDDLAREIARCREMTDQPFGVNVTLFPSASTPPYGEYMQAAADGGVKVVETAGRSPKELMPIAKDAGIKIIHKCTSVRHALSAERAGVDAISIDGFEAAGHPGEDDVGGLVLFAAAAEAVKIPLIASGGIGDGATMAAAFVLGAEGVNMGTRFCVTQEAPIHQNIKQAIVDARETDTILIFRTLRNTGRVLRNAVSQEVVSLENREGGAQYEDVKHLVAGVRGKAALESGAVDDGLVWASQVSGLINDIPTCEALISTMVADCKARLSAASAAWS